MESALSPAREHQNHGSGGSRRPQFSYRCSGRGQNDTLGATFDDFSDLGGPKEVPK